MARTAILPKKIVALLEDAHFLSVADIIDGLSNKGKKYNKTSVYRSLDKLLENGVVCKESFGDQEAMYELRKGHHDHAVCTNCEKILSVECHDNRRRNIPGFQPDHHHTTIYGICDSCLEKL